MLISRWFLYLQENKWHFLKFAPFFIKIPKNHRQWSTENLYRERNRWSTFTISKIIYCIYIVYSVQARFSSLLRSRSGRSHESSCHAVLTIYDFWPGPAQGEGLGVGGQPPTFWKKKRNLCWKKSIRLADIAEVSKFMIGPFWSYITRWAQEGMRYLILSW